MRRWPLIAALTFAMVVASVVLVAHARAEQAKDLDRREASARDELRRFESGASRSTTTTTADRDEGAGADTGSTTTQPDADDATIRDGDLLVISTVPGSEYGSVQRIDAGGHRIPADIPARCDRMYAAGGSFVCLTTPDLMPYRGVAVIRDLDHDARVVGSYNTGMPSRARISSEGSWASVTSFVTGDSYLDSGQFATRTLVIKTDGSRGAQPAERFAVSSTDPRYTATDGNWWGGTPIPGQPGRFLMTYGTGGTNEVMRVDGTTNRAEPLLPAGSCPSVSPDGRYVVAKVPVVGSGVPALYVLHDLQTGDERVLGETRFVDDQAEWLDDHTIAYAIRREGTPANQPASDVWSLDIAPGSKPKVLVPFATSPVRYRDTRAH